MKWTVFWSTGPVDDPQDGRFEVEAGTFNKASHAAFLRCQATQDIDGIIRSDLLQDIENDRPTPMPDIGAPRAFDERVLVGGVWDGEKFVDDIGKL